ncbi:MAG: hypothetical protein FWC58_03155 [Desulfobulbus sp.]|nr:hypothetical protein [Desulfobulbus sp.]
MNHPIRLFRRFPCRALPLAALLAFFAMPGYAAEPGATSPACDLLTRAEASKILGKAVSDGKPGPDKKCFWEIPDGSGSILIQIMPAGNYHLPSYGEKYRKLDGIGKQAWVSDDAAEAEVQKQAIAVMVYGVKENGIIEALKLAVGRLK